MRLVSTTMKSMIAVVMMTILGFGVVSAQDVTERRGTMVLTEGRKYIVAFPQVIASPTEKPMPQPMQLLISSKSKTTVRVQTPAGINDAARMDKEYTVEANKVLKIPVSTAYMNTESETRKGYGIMVTSKKPISVSTYQAWMGNGEMARHLPVEGWGKNYYSMNFYQDRYGNSSGYKYRPAQILLVADKDNTVVSYTPTVDTEGGVETPTVRKGATQTITLEKGETFLIKAKIIEDQNKEWSTDLTSTWIRANKPIGVVSGHTKVAIMRYPDVLPPTGMFAAEAHFVRSNVHDAMLPLEMAGKKFVTTPCMYTPTRVVGQASVEFGIDDDRGDVIRVIALEDGTTVKAMRQDGSGLLNKWILKKGETRLETALEVATYWESDKPILMGQYGKSYAKILPPAFLPSGGKSGKNGEDAQGHPTVESGMPMLQYVPSVDRWADYGVFHAPEGMDNFFNIVFKSSEVGKIKVDGRSLTSAFGGAMRLLKGTEYAFIRTPIGAGDHFIETTDPNVRWAAWNYGSLDGLQQGRAYGTPISIDMTIPCDDSLSVKEELVCGDVKAEGKILPENTSCGSIFAVYPEELNNYELIVDEEFTSGDKKVTFEVKVLDKTKDATATVRVVSRSGKYIEKTYTYIADKISWTPSKLEFGTIPFNTPTSMTFTIKNEKTDRPVNIRKIRVMGGDQVFLTNPTGPITLGPSESREITVTAQIKTAPLVVDTVICELDCYDQKTVELRVRGEEPKIYVSDVDWGTVPASSPGIERVVSIQNGSRVVLNVTGFDEKLLDGSNNGKFFNPVTMDGKPLKSAFPLAIPGNGTYDFKVTYSPKTEVSVAHRVDVPFYSNATGVDNIAVLKGSGNDVNVQAYTTPWIERVIDVIQTSQNINEYTQRVSFENLGDQPVTYEAPVIRGTDAANFRIVDNGNVGTFPVQLVKGASNQTRYVTVAFVPTELANRAAERTYKAEIVFATTGADGAKKDVVAPLDGTAWQPQVKGADLDFPGTMNVGDAAKVLSIPISNEHFMGQSNPTSGTPSGTYNVVITDIKITDAATKFEILNAPTLANPWVIKPGEAPVELQVRFDPSVSGNFESPYVISTNVGTKGQAPYEPTYKITARVQGGEFTVTDADAEQYVFNTKDMSIRIKHTENQTIRYNIAQPTGADASRFVIVDQYVDVAPGQEVSVPVIFMPDFVTKLRNGQSDLKDANNEWTKKAKTQGIMWRNGQFEAEVVISDDRNAAKTKTAKLTGNGLFLETTNLIKDSYSVAPGASVNIPVELNATPEALDAVGMTELRVRLSWDPKLVRPRVNPADFITAGFQAEGWTIRATPVNGKPTDASNSVEIDLWDERATPVALKNSTVPVFSVKFDAFLDKGVAGTFTSPINVYTYTVDHDKSGDRKDYTLFRDIPGKVTITMPCASTTRLVALGNFEYAVKPMRPNPVSSSGVISYSVGLTANTRIVLFNSMGEEVQTLVDEKLQAGSYEMTVDFTNLSTGTYFYRVISGPFSSEPQTVTVVK